MKISNQKMSIDLMLGRIKPYKGLGILKYHFNIHGIEYVLERVLKTKNKAHDFLISGLLPSNYGDLFSGNLFPYESNCLHRELLWHVLIIKNFTPLINSFLELKESFEVNFINGNYDVALDVLSSIESNVCHSLWSLKSRFMIEEYKNGLESNKEYLNYINANYDYPIVDWLADIYSYKSEKAISYHQYNNRMNRIINYLQDDESAKTFFRAKIYGIQKYTENELNDILYFENIPLSLIDICHL